MPDNTGIVRILMDIKQMEIVCLHNGLVDIKERNILRLPDKPKTTDTPASLNDTGFTQSCGELSYIACIRPDTFRNLIRIHGRLGFRDQDQRVNCSRP